MIDWSRVRTLQEEVGPEDFDEIIELFLEEVEVIVARLAKITDRSTLGEDLHFLKGSALSMGFAAFSDLCQEGETAAQNDQAEAIDVAAIVRSYHVSKQAFLDDLPQLRAA